MMKVIYGVLTRNRISLAGAYTPSSMLICLIKIMAFEADTFNS